MFFINFPTIWWDVILFAIIIISLLIGLLAGFRATTFVFFGDLIAILLAFAFYNLLITSLVDMIANIGAFKSNTDLYSLRFIIAYNIAPTIYYLLWFVSFNLVFWITYITLKFTLLKKHWLIRRKIYNSVAGGVINFIKGITLTSFAALFMGSGIFANVKTEIPEVYHNNYYENSININYLNITFQKNYFLFTNSSSDIRTAVNFLNFGAMSNYFITEFGNDSSTDINKLKSDVDLFQKYNQYTDGNAAENLAKNNQMASDFQQALSYPLDQQKKQAVFAVAGNRIRDYFADDQIFLEPKLNMIASFINLSSDSAQFFVNKFPTFSQKPININDYPNTKKLLDQFMKKVHSNVHDQALAIINKTYTGYEEA